VHNLKMAQAAAPRFHRLVTINYGSQKAIFKIYEQSQPQDIEKAIRSRFQILTGRLILTDKTDGCDVVLDGTLQTGEYNLKSGGGIDSKEKIHVTYFPIRGRADAIRLLLEDAQVNYESAPPENWQKFKEEGSKSGVLLFGQLPLVQHGELSIVQSNAQLRHFARVLGRYGNNLSENARFDSYLDGVEDIRLKYLKLIYQEQCADAAKATYLGSVDAAFAPFESVLSKSKEGYLIGSEFTPADSSLFALLDAHLLLSPPCLDKLPALKAFHARCAARPNIAAYLASGRRPKQVNGNGKGQ